MLCRSVSRRGCQKIPRYSITTITHRRISCTSQPQSPHSHQLGITPGTNFQNFLLKPRLDNLQIFPYFVFLHCLCLYMQRKDIGFIVHINWQKPNMKKEVNRPQHSIFLSHSTLEATVGGVQYLAEELLMLKRVL